MAFLDGTTIRVHQKAAGAAKKGGSSAQRDKREALGRSRGGFATKACVIADGSGRAIGFALAPGQANELPMAPVLLLLAALLGTIRRVVCDAAYSSTAWYALVMEADALPVVRANPTHPQQPHFDQPAYRRRHKGENLWPEFAVHRHTAQVSRSAQAVHVDAVVNSF